MFVYFAEVDTSSIVKRIVTLDSIDIIDNEDDTISEELGILRCTELFGNISPNTWVRTYKKGTIRARFAIIGGIYDHTNDVFLSVQPYVSWNYDSSIKDWKAPLTEPTIEDINFADGWMYRWNESLYQSDNTKGWEKVRQDGTS